MTEHESALEEHPLRAALGDALVAATVVEGQVGRSRANPVGSSTERLDERFLYCASCRTWQNQRARWTGVSWTWRCATCGAWSERPRVTRTGPTLPGAREEDE